ncbi:J domain-containing protein [bacterium]|nr:J domain-containing protein [bacterium]
MDNPYKTLGLAEDATQAEIKKAYRNLAKLHHPDLNPGKKASEDKFKEISQAYELIGTPEAKKKFDEGEVQKKQEQQQRESFYRTQQGAGRYSQSFGDGFSEEDFFSNLFRSAQQQQEATPRKGQDQIYDLSISFKDAVLGVEKELTLANGKTLAVKIPGGIETGKKLRFSQMGSPGSKGGPAGDAYVRIHVEALSGFRSSGDTIETEIPISFYEGLLGGEIEAPTIDGNVLLTIPPGSSTGTRLRIKGKGVVNKASRGDQIVTLKVLLPKKPSPELQAAVKECEKNFPFNPREAL